MTGSKKRTTTAIYLPVAGEYAPPGLLEIWLTSNKRVIKKGTRGTYAWLSHHYPSVALELGPHHLEVDYSAGVVLTNPAYLEETNAD